MAQVVEKVKDTLLNETKKIRDLRQDTYDLPVTEGMTTDHGTAILDTDNWLKATDGTNPGPSLLEDQVAREKIMRFDHERIPERVVHARGTGVHGYFKLTKAIPEYSYAGVLNDTSRTTPVFVRFSTVQGSKGSADTVRDVRGFAIKFYTDEGNWDIVGNNIPVFFIQDAIKFPDIIHAVKPEPHNEIPQGASAHTSFYDFISLQPESTHMLMWVMSDRAIPRSYRTMQGFGVNTYTLINKKGERHFVKFHWDPELGVHSLVWDEAQKLAGQDPDFHRKDLEEALNSGAPAKWTFSVQVLPESKENDFDFDILDATKIWPEELVPKIPIGELILNRVVDEFFTEVEQVAFCTSHIVPGVGFSDDPLLQGRNFSYFDTQLTRLGPNWEELPINRPVCPVMNFNRDGAMRHKITKGVNYWPNRFGTAAPQGKKFHAEGIIAEYPQKIVGIKQRLRSAKFQEHYNQAQLFYNSLHPHEKDHLIKALSFELNKLEEADVVERMIDRLNHVDNDLASQVALNVGGEIPKALAIPNHGKKASGISQDDFGSVIPTIKSRKIAILIADGFDLIGYEGIKAALLSGSAVVGTIGIRKSGVKSASGKVTKPDFHFEGDRSTSYDAIIIPGGEHVKVLAANGRVIHWIREAFGHCKPIGAFGEAVDLVKAALPLSQLKFADDYNSAEAVSSYGVVTARSYSLPSAAADLVIKEGDTGFIANFSYYVSKHRCWERESDGLCARVAF
ncbi:hypothetical protein M408DRAFT_327249 [Serendipita vermifera MAFF 305830]|uniref:Catalase n=1 Tax=Serendipita vermifera MAFF 305830 TaxID=933852 RepID=A0A0C3B4R8_SERVB|nr:hypothetical protein M408DRAFT_327249 [Serendipita vermifera MAFF 305830]